MTGYKNSEKANDLSQAPNSKSRFSTECAADLLETKNTTKKICTFGATALLLRKLMVKI